MTAPEEQRLYHHTSPKYRQSILANGLCPSATIEDNLPAVFLASAPEPIPNQDIWEVNVIGLEINEDWDRPGEWFQYFGTISSSRLHLLKAEGS